MSGAMALARLVQDETLDTLAEDDPRAIRSRSDLRRIHAVMGTRRILFKALRRMRVKPRRIIELGAGDASLTLQLARALAGEWNAVHLTLLDRQNAVPSSTLRAFDHLGWRVEQLNVDVLDWIREPPQQRFDLALANLFLHHFEEAELSALLAALSRRVNALCACEPRRTQLALAGSHLVGLLGANAVTREDAVLSVRAGFSGSDLSQLCKPALRGWQIEEFPAGLFTHCLTAVRPSNRRTNDADRI
ncbi:MAG: methyltransferase domain-containing protein [Burkholderiaceae bacterium]